MCRLPLSLYSSLSRRGMPSQSPVGSVRVHDISAPTSRPSEYVIVASTPRGPVSLTLVRSSDFQLSSYVPYRASIVSGNPFESNTVGPKTVPPLGDVRS